MKYNIKKIKEFVTDGHPQFIILERSEDPSIYIETEDDDIKKKSKTHYRHLDNGTIIKKVKRIKDGVVFTIPNWISLYSDINGFLMVEFLEDLVHCIVYDANLDEFTIEINEISVDENDDYEEEEEEGESEHISNQFYEIKDDKLDGQL